MNLYDQKINYLVPVFNREKLIEETIESIVIDIENFNDKKIILLDDGSEDASLNIMKNFKVKNNLPFIEIHHQKNMGIVAARNKLISLASNEAWLFLLDSDDKNIAGRTIQILKYMTKYNINVCGAFLKCFGFRDDIFSYPSDNYTLKKMCKHIAVFGNPAVTFSPRIKSFLRYTVTPEDFNLFKDLADSELKFGNICEPLVEYRTHFNQITKEDWYKAPNVNIFTKAFNIFLIILDPKISISDKLWFLKHYLALGKIKSLFK
mgnify:CR=1 FL=1|tara:strand:+ start:58 stop:846 length:789 start_codon:yes stop_codon:yes gene_type:complete